MIKVAWFEYFLKHLVNWHCEYYNIPVEQFNNDPRNNLSKLKVIKLHFFACSTDSEALDIFDNFHALPYGHVESDIYDNLHLMSHFRAENSRLFLLSNLDQVLGGEAAINIVIDRIVNNLKARNYNLITLDPFELVELSHRWFSWNFTFQAARKTGSFSKSISKNLIKQETKYYSF